MSASIKNMLSNKVSDFVRPHISNYTLHSFFNDDECVWDLEDIYKDVFQRHFMRQFDDEVCGVMRSNARGLIRALNALYEVPDMDRARYAGFAKTYASCQIEAICEKLRESGYEMRQ